MLWEQIAYLLKNIKYPDFIFYFSSVTNAANTNTILCVLKIKNRLLFSPLDGAVGSLSREVDKHSKALKNRIAIYTVYIAIPSISQHSNNTVSPIKYNKM